MDFPNYPRSNVYYGGSERKAGILVPGREHMVKLRKRDEFKIRNNHISEYLGSHIFDLLGMHAQETFLGTFEGEGRRMQELPRAWRAVHSFQRGRRKHARARQGAVRRITRGRRERLPSRRLHAAFLVAFEDPFAGIGVGVTHDGRQHAEGELAAIARAGEVGVMRAVIARIHTKPSRSQFG